jgi:hypothetical protein
VIRFGLRLAVAGGREAVARLVVMAVAVGLGVGLLLATLAGVNAVDAQNQRYAWLNTGSASLQGQPESATADSSTTDPLWWLIRRDYFDHELIARVDVAAMGPDSPIPPGMPRLPGPGQFYASPAMSALLASTPSDQLADRFPGQQVGTIGDAALPGPDSLVIVVGHSPDELSHVPGAKRATSIETISPRDCSYCVVGLGGPELKLVLAVVAAAMLFPVLIFIGTATRLTASRREQRLAAMRLIGATPRQVSVISAAESTTAAVVGTVIGFALFFRFRHTLATIPFTGAPFYPADLSLTAAGAVLVAVGIPAGAAVAALMALRRVRISPLGVTRRVTPLAPRAYRAIPLLLGIGELTYFVGRRPETTNGQVAAFLSGILLIMIGLIIAGPWLTMVGARILARRSSRPDTLIAARRLADNPQAGFRSISGLVLALFVTTTAIGVITTIMANQGAVGDDTSGDTTLFKVFEPDNPAAVAGSAVTNSAAADLRSTPGVHSVAVIHENRAADRGEVESQLSGLVSCAELVQTPAFGRCPSGAAVAAVWTDIVGPDTSAGPETVWTAAPLSIQELNQLPLMSIVVTTDGSRSATEKARTVIELGYPQEQQPPYTDGDFESDGTRSLTGWKQLANVAIIASLIIAGCSLAVSIVGGLNERKRPFSLLRLSGVQLPVLRRVVALESALPLIVVAAVAIGVGFLAAQLFLEAQMDYTLRPPGASYYLIVLAGLAAALGIIASTLPLLERITGPETARNE